MGEVADDMVEGFCCSICGDYFQEAHGYPVECAECWEDKGVALAHYACLDEEDDKEPKP